MTTPNTHGSAFLFQRTRAQLLEGAASATVKALLRDDTVTVRATGYEADYNPATRTMHVPAFSMRADDDPRLLNTFRGTLDRACGRVAFTDYEALAVAEAAWAEAGPRLKALVEVFETPRVEKLWGRRNPGSVRFIEDMHAYWGEKTGGAAATDPAHLNAATREPIGVFGALLQGIARFADGTLKLADMHPVTAMLMQMAEDEIVAGLQATTTREAIAAADAVLKKLADPPPPPEESDDQDDQGSPPPPSDDEQEEQEEPEKGGAAPDEDKDEEPDDDAGAGDDDAEEGEDCKDEGAESPESEEPGTDAPEGNTDGSESDEDGGEGTPGDGDDDTDADGEDEEDSEKSDEDEDGEGSDEDEDEEGEEAGDNEPDDGPPSLGDAGGRGRPVDEEPDAPEEGPLGEGPPLPKGVGPAFAAESAVEALGGDWGELPTAGELVAGEILKDPDRRPYTIHPDALALDRVERFDAKQREKGKQVVKGLRGAGSAAASYLANHLRDVLAATKQTLYVGGLDDGEDIDEEALPGVALGFPASSIYADTFANHDDNAFVMVLVDCSGSMGTSSPTRGCPKHGVIIADHWVVCQQKLGSGPARCGEPIKYTVSEPAGYAAVTALALHEALRLTNVPHGVMGFTTGRGASSGDNPKTPAGHPLWSRKQCSNIMKVFVEAPGLSDDGSALPYITGSGANLDGEALKEAAIYAANNAGEASRIVMLVVSDGLPSAADDRPMNGIYLKRMVEEVAQAGIEVYGIGIGINPKVYAQFFPELPALGRRAATGFVTLEDGARGLSVAVLGRLVQILGKSVGHSRSA